METKKSWCLLLAGIILMLVTRQGMAQRKAEPPYRCGFVLESQAAIRKVYGPELVVLDLHPGDVIADIGGSNGYRMGMFATICDSLNIVVQDIDTLCLNPTELEAVVNWYSTVKGSALHSTFDIVIGDERHTHLPEKTFDKILVTVAYHHFGQPGEMMRDIAGKLKPEGKIYLIENVVRKHGQRRRRLCDDPLMTEAGLRETFVSQGFVVEAVHPLGRWWTKMFVLRPATQL